MAKRALVVLLFFTLLFVLFLHKEEPGSNTSTQPIKTITPIPQKHLTAEEIKAYIGKAAQLREEGKYTEGEQKITRAYTSALALKNKELIIEAGNNASIQYRLIAGKLNREGKKQEAAIYSQKSLDIYHTFKESGWLQEENPIIMRNWAHALLYAGKLSDALPILEASYNLQTTPAAKGDELCHNAAGLIAFNQLQAAKPLVQQGTTLIVENEGSPVWLTFCYMTQATIHAREQQKDLAQQTLMTALALAKEKNLTVRQQEISYMLSMPSPDVLQAVGAPIGN